MRSSRSESRGQLWFSTLAVVALSAIGCASGLTTPEVYSPFVQREVVANPRACFDAIGHIPGNVPAPRGGECYCTPAPGLQAALNDHPSTRGISVDAVAAEYDRAGVKTAADHHGCNNTCEWGPHVVRGGRCLVSPEPGTINYELVLRGRPPVGMTGGQ